MPYNTERKGYLGKKKKKKKSENLKNVIIIILKFQRDRYKAKNSN
jgi:hypothetical protein